MVLRVPSSLATGGSNLLRENEIRRAAGEGLDANRTKVPPWWKTAAGLGILFAFSPALLDLIQQIRSSPSHAYLLLAPILMGLVWMSHQARPASIRRGALPWVLGGAIALELLGLASGTALLVRIGLALAIIAIGMAYRTERIGLYFLALGLIPVPGGITILTSPALETAWGEIGVGVWGWLGYAFRPGGPLIESGGEVLELQAPDSGIVTAFVLAEVAFARSLVKGFGLWRGAAEVFAWTLAALPVQILLVVLAVGTLALGEPRVGRIALTQGPWIVCALGFISWQLYRMGRPRPTRRKAIPNE